MSLVIITIRDEVPAHFLALRTTAGLCVRRGIWKTSRPELKPIKDTTVENIFYSSSVCR
jgi:hypothetical protein